MTTTTDERLRLVDFLMICAGTAIYAFGLVFINIANRLAEGGVTGITLILRYWFSINPAYSTLLINIPLIIIGYHYLGKKSLIYTVYGTVMLSLWIWIWQRFPAIHINIHHDLFIAGVLAGILGGGGSGLVYRFGGTTGGTDVIAKIFEHKMGIPMGQTLFALDACVLTASLSYIDLRRMMYTLLASFVFSRIVNFIQDGAYSARGMIIMTQFPEKIAHAIMDETNRGASYLMTEGAYSGKQRKAVYCVMNQGELTTVKRIVDRIDNKAFISILDVNEVVGEGFTYAPEDRTKDEVQGK